MAEPWSNEFHTCMITMKHPSGNALDNIVWTLHFEILTTPASTGMASAESGIISKFLGPLDVYLADEYNGAVCEFKWYHMQDAKPRVPVRVTQPHTIVAGSGRLPAEVALVLTFRAEYESGIKNSSKRNRIYWGPFASSANDTSTGRPTSGLRTAAATAIDEFIDLSEASSEFKWMAWSPTLGNAWAVKHGWVDDAWDTQRRRGKATTARTLVNGG